MTNTKDAALEALSATFVTVTAPMLRLISKCHRTMPRVRDSMDRAQIQIRGTDYYEPTYPLSHLPAKLGLERYLPGIDFNEAAQLEMLSKCVWRDELRAMPRKMDGQTTFGFEGGQYGYGDADMLYNFIRLYKPARIVEIGCGQSTLMAQLAIAANIRDDAAYDCLHICIEPYEMPWLETIGGVTVVRERVETCDPEVFAALGENDILFIDSSHIIRPYGDVLKEFHEIVPAVAPGVFVHVHDMLTPRDYPERWLREDRRLWNEQYLVESFLAYNSAFEVACMTNWLKHNHFAALSAACGFVDEQPNCEPGAFWFRRKVKAG